MERPEENFRDPEAPEGGAPPPPPPGESEPAGQAERGAAQAEPVAPQSEETEPEAGAELSPQLVRRSRLVWVSTVRYGLMGRSESFLSSFSEGLERGKRCVVRTRRGTEVGEVVTAAVRVQDATFRDRPGEVLRLATPTDLARGRRIEQEDEPRERKFCAAKIAELDLAMRLSAVEHLLGGERIIFYFRADGRVDFRQLVRELAREYHTRIEMRQIGVRDEARLLADFEHCGQPLCCKRFMREIEPVMMRMAKLQKTTLDPTKISGRCGRLMCCLRFEDEVYRELRRELPGRGTRVWVDDIEAEVLDAEILTQLVHLRTADGRVLRVPLREVGRTGPSAASEPDRADDGKPDAGASGHATSPGAAKRPGPEGAPTPRSRGEGRRSGRPRGRRGRRAGRGGAPQEDRGAE